ncbi:IS5 family transposase [Candidatus Woesearchaeota archaeon]|nr:IS5 family transposase [Candidatus Woesearchaeota archaeon]
MKTNLNETNYKNLTREERGQIIAQKYNITRTDKGDFKVPSQFGMGNYIVKMSSMKEECDCPDYQTRKGKCKHIYAVEYILNQEVKIDNEGNTVITQTKTIKVSYPQDWKSYNKAKCNEQPLFMELMADLVKNVKQQEYGFGRPSFPLQDGIYLSALKVYSTFSLRRFTGMTNIALEKKYIEKPCNYVTISNIMNKPELTSILQNLIQLSSLPLKSVETKFAVDSSGFSTCRFARYFSYKHQKDMRYRQWVKAHLSVGIKTNIVTAVSITGEYSNDCPEFKPLIEKTAENFRIDEVTGDKAYSSRENHDLVNSLGGTAFIPFKDNATGKSRGSSTWNKMFHYFQFNKEEFLEHYHLRSNIETTNHMIKSKLGDYLRSKTKIAQVNELLLKVLCHNICCLIEAVYELNINPQFCLKSQESV